MTSEPMAIKATFSDFRIVKTRKLAQLILEIPIEEADAALTTLGGLPRSDRERWCAIARLEDSQKPHEPLITTKRQFCDLPLPQQAGILTKDSDFQFWINKGFLSEPDCAAEIRKRCGVESRADIGIVDGSAEKWKQLLREYEGVR